MWFEALSSRYVYITISVSPNFSEKYENFKNNRSRFSYHLVVAIGAAIYIYEGNTKNTNQPTPTPSPTPTVSATVTTTNQTVNIGLGGNITKARSQM